MNRRELLTAGVWPVWRGKSSLAPVKSIAADVKPVRIRTVESFKITIPATPTEIEAGYVNRLGVTRVVTESGVRGYSFTGAGGGRGRGSGPASRAQATARRRSGGRAGRITNSQSRHILRK